MRRECGHVCIRQDFAHPAQDDLLQAPEIVRYVFFLLPINIMLRPAQITTNLYDIL